MTRLADLILTHKRLVVAFWVVVTVAAFAAVGPAGDSLSQQFNIPGREGFETNSEHRRDLRQRRRRRAARPGRHASEGHDRRLARRHARARRGAREGEAALPDARIASYASTHDRAFVSDDGRTTFALVYIPADGGVDPGQAEARQAQAALAGVTVGGSPVEVTGLDALRALRRRQRRRRHRVFCSRHCSARSARCSSSSSSSARSWRSCRC